MASFPMSSWQHSAPNYKDALQPTEPSIHTASKAGSATIPVTKSVGEGLNQAFVSPSGYAWTDFDNPALWPFRNLDTGAEVDQALRKPPNCTDPDSNQEWMLSDVHGLSIGPWMTDEGCDMDTTLGSPQSYHNYSDWSPSALNERPQAEGNSPTATACTTSDQIKCSGCAAVFTGKYARGNFSRHKRHQHGAEGEPRVSDCEKPGCDKTFNRPDARKMHYKRRHPELLS